MAGLQVLLPVQVGASIAPFLNRLYVSRAFLCFPTVPIHLTSICSGVHMSRSILFTGRVSHPPASPMPPDCTFADMRAHRAVDAGTSNAEEDAPASQLLSITLKGDGQVPRRPSRICKSARAQTDPGSNGSPFLRQSAHALLSGCLTRSRRIRACRSVVALSELLAKLNPDGAWAGRAHPVAT